MHQVQPLSGEHPEVLVVEDNPANQSVAEHMLKKLGFRPRWLSGDQALNGFSDILCHDPHGLPNAGPGWLSDHL